MQNWGGTLRGLLTTILVLIMLGWAIISFTNGDFLWFMTSLDAKVSFVTIYWDGETHILDREDPGCAEIIAAFSKGVGDPAGYESKVALSEESIQTYREKQRLLEITFEGPIQIHLPQPFSKAKTYLIPLNSTHAHWYRVFSFPGLVPHAYGPLNMHEENFQQLYAAVESALTLQ